MIKKIKDYENVLLSFMFEKHWNVLLLIFSSIIGVIVQISGFSFESGDWIYCYEPWFQNVIDKGGIMALGSKISDYPSGFDLFFSLSTYIPLSPLASFKLVIAIFLFICAIAAYLITMQINTGNQKSKIYASLSYSVVVLLPSMILNTSVWGQVDSMWVSFMLIAIYFICKKNYGLAFLFVGISLSTKQVAIMIIPALGLLYLREKKVSIIHFLNILVGYFLMSIPAIIMGKSIKDIISPCLNYGTGVTATIVMNFSNIYALMTPYPSWSSWVTNEIFSDIGKWFCIFVIGIVILVMHYKKVNVTGSNFLLVATMFVVIFCNFLPGVHDRYMILADVLSIVYVVTSKRINEIWIPIFINFVSIFNVINYLHGVSDVVSNTRIILVQIVSVGFLMISLYFVYYVLKILTRQEVEIN